MPPENPLLRVLRSAVQKVPPLIGPYRRLRDFSRHDPLVMAAYRKLFERSRLTLPWVAPETLCPASGSVWLPALYPLFAGEDAPLNDLLFLLNLAKGRKAQRILEVGTYRARTTYALHRNCPEATVISYDIQLLDSRFRRELQDKPQVELRHASFAESADALRQEAPFDLIFVDGSHRFEHVVVDSRLAVELAAPQGIVVWHDYRYNGYRTRDLRVPEALTLLCRECPIVAVSGTTCAVHVKGDVPKPH